jgi:hypothetical protein
MLQGARVVAVVGELEPAGMFEAARRSACHPRAARHDGQSAMRGLTGGDGSDVLDAKSLSSARQEFVELGLGGPDNLVLQHLYQPVD